MTSVIDEIGNRYGVWEVIDRVPSRGRARWLLTCPHGHEIERYGYTLRSGRYARTCYVCDLLDEVGRVYNKWTVLRVAKPDQRGRVRYHVRCECGRESIVRRDELHSSRTTMCQQCAGKVNKTDMYRFDSWRINEDGYVVGSEAGHPVAMGGGAIHEHWWVMWNVNPVLAEAMKRRGDIDINHINGQRADNRPENLEYILRGKHGRGITLEGAKTFVQMMEDYNGTLSSSTEG